MPGKLTELQLIDLNILRTVVDICNKHSLTYYALGGTLLGAVRHQGFIPWDDDIDIALPRPDYQQLLDACNDELSNVLIVQNYKTMPDDPAPTYMSRIGKVGTLVAYGVANKTKEMPVWIDVFPFDAMPSNNLLRSIQKYRLLYHRMKFQFSCYDANVHQHRPNRPLHERLLMKFRETTKVGENWNPAEMLAQTERAALSYNYDEEDYFVNLFGAYKFREMFPKAWFGNGIALPFEDGTINCPIEYDKVLSQMYGDYMTPPVEEDRAMHHCLSVITLGEEEPCEE